MADTYYKQNHLKKLRAFCQTAKLGSIAAQAPGISSKWFLPSAMENFSPHHHSASLKS